MEKKKILEANMVIRVRNEVEIHSRLHHPSILQLYHFFEDNQNVYLVMEICPNGELYRYIQNRIKSGLPPISEAEIRFSMQQVVRGVQYLQQNGIIHRDLKLSNILLTKTFDIKIADFGLAVRLDSPDGEQLTMCGTPNYISPEIVQRRPYGLASDIWSIGCMLYTFIVGKPPFDSGAVKQTLDLVSKANYHIPQSISPEASSLIDKLLQKNPTHRMNIDEVLLHQFFRYPSDPLKDIYSPARVENSQLPALSTLRLKPIKQATKFGLVEIMASGHIVLDFNEDKYRIVVNSDSSSILFYSKPISSSWSIVSPPTHSCTRATVPEKYHKRYRYLCKFVEVVKSKTPKITYHSPQAECYFMENDPQNDFQATFISGLRILWTRSKSEVVIGESSPPKDTKIMVSSDNNTIQSAMDILSIGKALEQSIPPMMLNNWRHVVDCYKQCWEISKQPNNKYPLVLRSGLAQSSENNLNSHNIQEQGNYVHKAAPSVHLTDIQSLISPSVLTTAQTMPIKRMDNRSTLTSCQVSTRIFGSTEYGKSSDYAFQENIGWCVKKSAHGRHEFVMLFMDGSRLVVEQSSGHDGVQTSQIKYAKCQSAQEERFKIDRNLPSPIKEKLAAFPRFIESSK